jgi:cytochrome c5
VVFDLNSKHSSRRNLRSAAFGLAAVAALLSGCSGPSSYNESADPPQAVASVVGSQPTSAAGADPVTVTVRAQSQVILTGNASDGGAGSIGNFSWKQTDGAGTPTATLLYLDSDTVTFTAPAVSEDTTLHFTLTVTTAGNAAASAHVEVLVKAIDDINQFLSPPVTTSAPNASQHRFSIAVGTAQGLGSLANPAEPNIAADAQVCVTVGRTVNYVARDGNAHSVTLTPLQASATWSAAVGSAPPTRAVPDFAAYQNPRVTFAIPALNQDDLFVLFNNPVPGNNSTTEAANLNQQLVPADIDLAQLSLTATVAAGACDGTVTTAELNDKTLELLVLDENGNAVGSPGPSAAFTPDDLVSQQAGAPYETAQTAAAYYDAIDPQGAKTTLARWLDANCFDSTAPNYGVTPTSLTSAHATYTNNYDLGFGRDMYFTTCTATSPAVVKGLAKVGDMASVVLNYTSLEAAASKLNAFIAVAMEYSAATDATTTGSARSQRRFPKFYAFAPDDRDGSFKRVRSVNFDHRGEKYVPGTCTVCHGGNIPAPPVANFIHVSPTDYPTLKDPQVNATDQLGLGDTDSTFMPWDLDSLLYASAPLPANTDASFVGLSVNPADFSRSAQEPNLKKMNQLAYCTYQPEMENYTSSGATVTGDRFNADRALIARWYGGAPAADGTLPIDSGCTRGGAPTAGLLPNSTYSDSTSVPASWSSQGPASAPTVSDNMYHQVFARNCRACHTGNASIVDQFNGYAAFVTPFPAANNSNGVALVFQQAVMPLARLTMDRFWVPFSGGTSAASYLATGLQQAFPDDSVISALTTSGSPATAVAPGPPLLVATTAGITGALAPSTTTPYPLPRFTGITIDASASLFVDSYSWCLQPPGAAACSVTPTGASTATPSFYTTAYGPYLLQVTASNGTGDTVTNSYKFVVKDKVPTYVGAAPLTTPPTSPCPAGLSASIDSATPLAIAVSSCFNPLGDESTTPFALKVTNSSTQWTATVVPTTVAQAVPVINFAFTNSATGDATVAYQLCDIDDECANGQTTVHLTANLTANPVTYQTYLQPQIPNVFASPGAGFVAMSPGYAAGPAATSSPSALAAAALSLVDLLHQDTILPAGAEVTLTAAAPTSVVPTAAGALTLAGVPSNPITVTSNPNGETLDNFAYAPPAFNPALGAPVPYITCDINGKSLSNTANGCGSVTFTQNISANGSAASTAPVNIQVQALTTFSQTTAPAGSTSLYSILQTSCQTCHSPAGTTPMPTAYAKWLFTAGEANTPNSTATLTYPSISPWAAQTPVAATADTNGTAIAGDPAAAAVFVNPCLGTTLHTQVLAPTSNACATILQWVSEGAPND